MRYLPEKSPGGSWALGAAIEEAANVGEVVEAVTLKLLWHSI